LTQVLYCESDVGGMAEWFKAAVLKTVEGRKVLREFESLSLRQEISREGDFTVGL
jgi:hypothetical protein